MVNIGQKPSQETTSIYFNSIVRNDVAPLTVEDLPDETVEYFNAQIRLAFADEADAAVSRIRYLVPYILQSIDWDKYGIPLGAWQLHYYYRRERFISKTRLSYEDFLAHRPLQNAIVALGLEPEPTFEFILFLKYYYGMRSELKYSALEQLNLARKSLEESGKDSTVSIDINVNGRHFKISNTEFVKKAVMSIDIDKLRDASFVNDFKEGASRDKIRAIDYYMIKTLLDYLPMRLRTAKIGMYTQEQRNFGLSVLSFCGRLPDIDRRGECSKENNATFDKLMRDFRNVRIPFAMELFL